MSSFSGQIENWGGQTDGYLSFAKPDPRSLPFATLLEPADLDLVEGVYLWQGTPLIYIIDGERHDVDSGRLSATRLLLAMRGDADYMGVAGHGRLRVYRLGLDATPLEDAGVELSVPPTLTIPLLGQSRPDAIRASSAASVTQVVIGLLDDSIAVLIAEGLSSSEAISMVGRALFARFLADRELLPADMRERSRELFDSPAAALSTCKWLDETFNGDLLPVDKKSVAGLSAASLKVLGDISRRAPGGQLAIEWQESWAKLDFSQIPVGVLSQAYESYMQRHDSRRQSNEGGYYTPAPIAEMMIRGSLPGIAASRRAQGARILDPACGAGVFLVIAFRELVAEHWRAHGLRPDTKTLRSILYTQIAGFDVNDAALRFAALALYLISIELDPEPEPVEKLRFQNLRGTVLFDVGQHPDKLGSLGAAVGEEHAGAYDLVVGNPPWPTGSKQPNWRQIKERVDRICRKRWTEGAIDGVDVESASDLHGFPAFVSDGVPLPKRPMDLPFVWRAMEWAKPGAQITFALHGRLLFQQNEMRGSRDALFRSVSVRTVVNGAELRQTQLWPNVRAPFLVLFATNVRPSAIEAFKFVTPRYEPALNASGLMRIDFDSAATVSIAQITAAPWTLKALARGSSADLAIVEKVRRRSLVRFGHYWEDRPKADPSKAVEGDEIPLGLSGYGYQTVRPSSETTPTKPEPGYPARYLKGLPVLVILPH